ncbi:MAG: c-type cytochrome [Thermoanaerobaculum sp.]
MSRAVVNGVLALALAVSLVLHALSVWNPKKPNLEYAPDMAHQPRLAAFAAYPGFPRGMVLQPPPPGTVAVDEVVRDLGPGPEEALRAGRELTNPLPADDPRVSTRGAKLFAAFCQPCHGAGGHGDGPVAQRGFPPPPSLLAERALAMPDGQIYHVVSFGQQNMPAYAAQLSEEDRWLLVRYLRLLQRQTKP